MLYPYRTAINTHYLAIPYAPLNKAESEYDEKTESFTIPISMDNLKKMKCFQLDQNSLYKADRVYSPTYLPNYGYILQEPSRLMVEQFSQYVIKFAELLQTAIYVQNLLIHKKFNVFLLCQLKQFKNEGIWTWQVMNYVMTHMGRLTKNVLIDPQFRQYQIKRVFCMTLNDEYKDIEFITDVARNFYVRFQQTMKKETQMALKIAQTSISTMSEKYLKERTLKEIEMECTREGWTMWDIQQIKQIFKDEKELSLPKQLIKYSSIVMDSLLSKDDFTKFMNKCHVIQQIKSDIISSYRCIAPKGQRSHPQTLNRDQKCIQFTKKGLLVVPNFRQLYLQNINRVRNECKNHSGLTNNKNLLMNDQLVEMKEGNKIVSPQDIILWLLDQIERLVLSNVYLTSYVDPIWTAQRLIMLEHPCQLAEHLEKAGDGSVSEIIQQSRTRKINGQTDDEEEEKLIGRAVRRLIGNYANSSIGTWEASQKWKETFGFVSRNSLNRKINWMSMQFNQLWNNMVKISEKVFDYRHGDVPNLIKYLADVVEQFFRNIPPSPITFRIDDLYRYYKANNSTIGQVEIVRPFGRLLALIERISQLQLLPAVKVFKKKANDEIVEAKILDDVDILTSLIRESQQFQNQQQQFQSDDEVKSVKSFKSFRSEGANLSKSKKVESEIRLEQSQRSQYLSCDSSEDFEQFENKSTISGASKSKWSQMGSLMDAMDKLSIGHSSFRKI